MGEVLPPGPSETGPATGPATGPGPDGDYTGRRWRVVGGGPRRPIERAALRYLLAIVIAPPLGLLVAHAPMLLLIVLGPLGIGLIAAGFALALGAAIAMYPVMATVGLGMLLLLDWRAGRGGPVTMADPRPYALLGGLSGMITGLALADWSGAQGIGGVLLGLGFGAYGGWLGLAIGMVAGLIMRATDPRLRPAGFGPGSDTGAGFGAAGTAESAHNVIIEPLQRD